MAATTAAAKPEAATPKAAAAAAAASSHVHLGHDEALPAPKSHLLLLLLSLAPAFLPVPANPNIVVTASLAVFVGCWRSVKQEAPTESMTRKDAMKFPFIGSAVLLSLFIAFRFLPANLVNAALTLYFASLGTAALAASVLPFVEALFPATVREKSYSLVKGLKIPYVLDEPTDLSLTVPEVASGAAASLFALWYALKKHWLSNNALGLAFSITGVEHLSLGAVSTGVILLSGLFVYDIFWVFCTPVMVTVAKAFDAPIKLLFPRFGGGPMAAKKLAAAAAAAAAAAKGAGGKALSPFSMLGLGDIVIPGVFVALLLRFDCLPERQRKFRAEKAGGAAAGAAAASARATRSSSSSAGAAAEGGKKKLSFSSCPYPYFAASFFGYVLGLGATIVVMNVFDAAQPALLYIVPAVLGATALAGAARGELKAVFSFSEEPEEEEEEEEKKKKEDKEEEKKKDK